MLSGNFGCIAALLQFNGEVRVYSLDGTLIWFATPSETPPDAINPADLADIRAILNGDRERYAQIVARYQPVISKYMWHFSRVRTDHEQLVHDVFVDAYFGLLKFRADGPFLHWLRKIATRIGYRYWKANADRNARGELSLEAHHEEIAAGSGPRAPDERAELLQIAMNSLQPRDRVVLSLLYVEEMSAREAAEVLGWSPILVRVQAHRARQRLEVKLDRLLGKDTHE